MEAVVLLSNSSHAGFVSLKEKILSTIPQEEGFAPYCTMTHLIVLALVAAVIV